MPIDDLGPAATCSGGPGPRSSNGASRLAHYSGQIVGHSKRSRIAVTLAIYIAGGDRSRREVIGKLSELFGSQAG